MKVGFIGLGRMGGHMCSNVIKAGFETYVSDLVPALVEQKVAEGAIGCKDNLEVAANMDIGFTMLPNGAIVEAVMCGPKGVLAHCKPGTIIVDMSSVAPGTTQKMAKIAAEHGVKYMDAPVSGGTIGAQKGTLTIMCGADEETFEKAKPVLEAIGKRIMRIGGTGMGRRDEDRQQHAARREHGLSRRSSRARREARSGQQDHVRRYLHLLRQQLRCRCEDEEVHHARQV